LNFFLNLENNLAIPQEGNGKIWKKINFEIWIEIWKNLAISLVPRKFEMKKFENFHFWNSKWNFRLKFEKMAISREGDEKIEMKQSYILFMPPRSYFQ
jgi:hypothetical protein